MSLREDGVHVFSDDTKLSHYSILTDSHAIFSRFEDELDNTEEEEGIIAKTVSGEYINMQVTVVKYPPGASNLALIFEEMLRRGVRVAVKVGFGVYLRPARIRPRIALASVRLDGLMENLFPPQIPPVGSISVVNNLSRSMENRSIDHDIDLVVSVGIPYWNLENGFLPPIVRKWDVNVVDTDTSVLYLMAYQRKALVASIVIPALTASEAEEYGLWTEHKVDKNLEPLFSRLAPSVLEGLWQVKESAERGRQLEQTRHKHEPKH